VKKFVLLLILCASIGCANAATISYSDTAPVQLTYWSQILTLDKFDPTLGNLLSVTWELTGHVEGATSFESRDAQPATVTTTLGAILSLYRMDSSLIVAASPSVSTSDGVTAYDGTIDFGGGSGRAHPGLSATKVESVAFTDPPDDLSAYIGSGTFNVTATGSGNSFGSGAGNLILMFQTSGSSVAKVTYEYTPVPEPSALGALASGLLSLMGLVRYRRR